MYYKKYIIVQIVLYITILSGTVSGQTFYGYDGFIDRELFFKPVSISPNKIGVFEQIAPGFFDHPLHQAFVNPARLGKNIATQNYIYAEYRTLPAYDRYVMRLAAQQETYEYYSTSTGYPISANRVSVKADEPDIAAAWIFHPSSLQNMAIGISYRHIHRTELYYDQFRSLTYSGRNKKQDFWPIQSVRPERNDFRQRGYFPSIMASMQFSEKFSAGLRVSLSYFTGDGHLLDGRMFFDDTAHIDRHVEQKYMHYEAAGGIQYAISDHQYIGFSTGFLSGKVEQDFGMDYGRIFMVGNRNITGYWRYNDETLTVNEQWNRDGYRYYGTIELQQLINRNLNNRIRFIYTLEYITNTLHQSGNAVLNSADSTRSIGATELNHINISENTFLDGILGGGNRSLWTHRIGVTRHLVYGSKTELLIGLQFIRMVDNIERPTIYNQNNQVRNEFPDVNGFTSTFQNTQRVLDSIVNERIRNVLVNLPVVLRFAFSEKISMEGGLLLQYQDINFEEHMKWKQLSSIVESPYGTTEFPYYDTESSRNYGIQSVNAAGFLSIGYRILPRITLHISGLTGTRNTTDSRGSFVGHGTLTFHEQQNILSNTRMMLGLEAGI